jgi:serine protease Do
MLYPKYVVPWYLSLLWLLSYPVQAGLPEFTELARKHGPTVVNISTTQKQQQLEHKLPDGMRIPEGTPFDDFRRHFFGEGGSQGLQPQPRQEGSLGSGFIISEDGYVLTNYHVVMNAGEIIVRLQDRRELEAKLIGADERSDIALLKIEADNLPVAKIGSEKDLEVGEWVLAIGSPFGFDHSVTAGIVSAKGRSLPGDPYVSFIQTDVAINPGNSGGPLFNLNGEVVGINSQIYSRTGGFMGLSFAIPMSIAMNVVKQLRAQGEVTRGWLGVQVQDVTSELAESFGMRRPHGALVARVLPDSPAEAAGFRVGDVIVKFNDHKVETSTGLPPLVGMTPIGESVRVAVIRKKRQALLTVRIGKLSAEAEHQAKPDKTSAVLIKLLGIKVTAATNEEAGRQPNSVSGILVLSVNQGPAMVAGIQRGDVILRVQNEDISNVSDFSRVVESLPSGKSIAVLVQRRGSPVFLAIKLDD